MMEGIIVRYDSQKGYGFIQYEDGSIFFHLSSFIDKSFIPEVGMEVYFEVGKNSKGDMANNITIRRNSNNSKFLKLGDLRVKISTIRNYGISDYKEELVELEKKVERQKQKKNEWENDDWGQLDFSEFEQLELERDIEWLNKCNSVIKKDIEGLRYLYIETFQNDRYRFFKYDCNFDIDKKIEELDMLLT